VGQRTDDKARQLVHALHERTDGRFLNLITSDEYPADATARAEVYAEAQPSAPGTPAPRRLPKALVYATVPKTRAGNRVVQVEARLVFGALRDLAAALCGAVRALVNTAFVERSNGTDRLRNSRRVRKTWRFSKDWGVHQALNSFTRSSSNCCGAVRALRGEVAPRRYRQRTPALAAGLAEHVWSPEEGLLFPSSKRHKLPPWPPR
jgi:hypothetical protein